MTLTQQPAMPNDYCVYGTSQAAPYIQLSRLASCGYLGLYDKNGRASNAANDVSQIVGKVGDMDITDHPESPKKQKRVVFADALGLELEKTRIITAGRDTPPNISASFLASLFKDSQPKEQKLSLCFDFKQPISNYIMFCERLKRNNVSLESVSLNENMAIGTVKVKNLTYHKTVLVRVTFDGWKSHTDVNAYFVNNGLATVNGKPIDSEYDMFSFQFDFPTDCISQTPVEFAICFRCQGHEYWDNNSDRNYKIVIDKSVGDNHNLESSIWSTGYDHYGDDSMSQFAVWKVKDNSIPYW